MKNSLKVLKVLLISFAIVFLSQLIYSLPIVLYVKKSGNYSIMETLTKPYFNLFFTIFTIIVVVLYSNRNFKKVIIFEKENAVKKYVIGYLIGIILITAAFLICYFTKGLTFTFNKNVNIVFLLIYFIGFLIQGMSEELVVRGYTLGMMERYTSKKVAIFISSLFFGLLHLLNPNFGILPIINITLVGILFALIRMKTHSFWAIGAIHSAWNFFQGNILGIRVSGLSFDDSVLTTTYNTSMSLINGGEFGIEGGLASTIVLLIAIIYYYIKYYKPNEKEINSKTLIKYEIDPKFLESNPHIDFF